MKSNIIKISTIFLSILFNNTNASEMSNIIRPQLSSTEYTTPALSDTTYFPPSPRDVSHDTPAAMSDVSNFNGTEHAVKNRIAQLIKSYEVKCRVYALLRHLTGVHLFSSEHWNQISSKLPKTQFSFVFDFPEDDIALKESYYVAAISSLYVRLHYRNDNDTDLNNDTKAKLIFFRDALKNETGMEALKRRVEDLASDAPDKSRFFPTAEVWKWWFGCGYQSNVFIQQLSHIFDPVLNKFRDENSRLINHERSGSDRYRAYLEDGKCIDYFVGGSDHGAQANEDVIKTMHPSDVFDGEDSAKGLKSQNIHLGKVVSAPKGSVLPPLYPYMPQPPYGYAPYMQQPPYVYAPYVPQPPYGYAPYMQQPPYVYAPYVPQPPYGYAPYVPQPPYVYAPYAPLPPYGYAPYAPLPPYGYAPYVPQPPYGYAPYAPLPPYGYAPYAQQQLPKILSSRTTGQSASSPTTPDVNSPVATSAFSLNSSAEVFVPRVFVLQRIANMHHVS